jgi:hypothetical protein
MSVSGEYRDGASYTGNLSMRRVRGNYSIVQYRRSQLPFPPLAN